MNKTFLSIFLAFLIVGGLVVFQATKESSAEVFLPSDILKRTQPNQSPSKGLSRIRVGGRVAELPVEYKVEPNFELRFHIQDPGKDTPSKGTVAVVYNGIRPDMFASGRDVIIDGEYKDGVLNAKQLLTQCPSKYEPPSPGGGNAAAASKSS